MLLKDYVKGLVDLLNNDPECGELEVWTYSDLVEVEKKERVITESYWSIV